MLAVNTLGVLYIVESGDSIGSVEDLRGKTIYASGKGATPEYALNYILTENGIDPEKDVNDRVEERTRRVSGRADGRGQRRSPCCPSRLWPPRR